MQGSMHLVIHTCFRFRTRHAPPRAADGGTAHRDGLGTFRSLPPSGCPRANLPSSSGEDAGWAGYCGDRKLGGGRSARGGVLGVPGRVNPSLRKRIRGLLRSARPIEMVRHAQQMGRPYDAGVPPRTLAAIDDALLPRTSARRTRRPSEPSERRSSSRWRGRRHVFSVPAARSRCSQLPRRAPPEHRRSSGRQQRTAAEYQRSRHRSGRFALRVERPPFVARVASGAIHGAGRGDVPIRSLGGQSTCP